MEEEYFHRDFENYFVESYDQCSVLSNKCERVVVEAKRVLLSTQLDKMVNVTMASLTIERQPLLENQKTILPIDNTDFQRLEDILNIDTHTFEKNRKIENKTILSKYFTRWKAILQKSKQSEQLFEKNIEAVEKLDKFIDKLKEKKYSQSATQEPTSEVLSKISKIPRSSSNYKNRFSAQKSIIEMQKAKLDEQNKIIEELKLGIIREDLMKSIANSRTDIREIFANCSVRLKTKAPLIVQTEEREKLMVATQKAPKIVQKMEQRAIERANNRQIILERKRLIEETRKKLLEEAIEKKRVLEEEERKRALEDIKEKRKKEMELEKIKQEKRHAFLEQYNKAVDFHNYLLLKQCFQKLFNHYQTNKYNLIFAMNHYNHKLFRNVLNDWLNFIESKYKLKYEIADAQYHYKILKLSLKQWKELRIENKRNMQVAEDLYDFRLTSNTFILWHRYVCCELTKMDEKCKIADKHNNRRMLFQYFYQWRSLPAVNQLEKAKEEKKRKWREKVWELLPDYRPPDDL